MSDTDRSRVDTQTRGYNLRSKTRDEHAIPAASRVPSSPIRDDINIDEQDPTLVQASQEPLFDSNEFTHQNGSEHLPPTSKEYNKQNLLDLKKKILSSVLRCERLSHHLDFLKNCDNKNIIPKGLLLEKTINPMKCRDLGEFDNVNAQIQEILMQSSKEIIGKLIHYYDQAVVSEHDFLRSPVSYTHLTLPTKRIV